MSESKMNLVPRGANYSNKSLLTSCDKTFASVDAVLRRTDKLLNKLKPNIKKKSLKP